MFSESRYIRVSETIHRRCLRGSILLNLSENITFFLNLKTKEWDLKVFMFNYWNDLLLGSVETYFLAFHTCLWKEPPQVSESVVFAEFEEKIPRFFKSKTGELDLKILKFNYWNDLVLGSVETCFLEVGAYVPLKRAITDLWEGRFCWIWLKLSHFLKYKNREEGPKHFIV